ncbi:hypothetical protein A2U01_0076875, partial [Trifolium medium]|nr:hypothetical protein [Trifolium medium]
MLVVLHHLSKLTIARALEQNHVPPH